MKVNVCLIGSFLFLFSLNVMAQTEPAPLLVGNHNRLALGLEQNGSRLKLHIGFDGNSDRRSFVLRFEPVAEKHSVLRGGGSYSPQVYLHLDENKSARAIQESGISMPSGPNARTHQTIELGALLDDLAAKNKIIDERGRVYSRERIGSLNISFSTADSNGSEPIGENQWDSEVVRMNDLRDGEMNWLRQIEHIPDSETSFDPLLQKINLLSSSRHEEMPFDLLLARTQKDLVEIGYPEPEAIWLARFILDEKNLSTSCATLLMRHEELKRMLARSGPNRAAEAAASVFAAQP